MNLPGLFIEILINEIIYNEMKKNALKKAEELSIEKMAGRLLAVYKNSKPGEEELR